MSAGAGDRPAQRKVLAEIAAVGRGRFPGEAVLNPHPRFKRNQPFVDALLEMHAPRFDGEVARIKRALQDIDRELQADLAALVVRDARELFEIALELGPGLETACREAFEPLGDDGGVRLVAHQLLGLVLKLDPFVADGRRENVAPLVDMRPHFLDHLTPVLFDLKLAVSNENRFAEFPFGGIFEMVIEALQRRAAFCDGGFQLEIELGIAAEPLQIVEHDDIALALACGPSLVCAQVLEKLDHALPPHEVAFAREVVFKHPLDFDPAELGPLAAAMLLAL